MTNLRSSAANMAAIAAAFETNANLAWNDIEASAWNTATLRLLDARDVLADAADELEGVWRPVTDTRQLSLGGVL